MQPVTSRVWPGLIASVVAASAIAGGNDKVADDVQQFGHGCAGVWIGNLFDPDALGTEFLTVVDITPLDAFGIRMSYRLEPINPLGPLAPGVFDDATVVPDGHGVLHRRGRNSYEGRVIAYVSGPPDLAAFTRGEIQWFFVIEFTADCEDDTLTEAGLLHAYSAIDDPNIVFPPLGIMGVHDQDQDQDGFPDPGEKPLVTLPFEATAKRFE